MRKRMKTIEEEGKNVHTIKSTTKIGLFLTLVMKNTIKNLSLDIISKECPNLKFL